MLRKLILTSVLVATTSGLAFAQSDTAPSNKDFNAAPNTPANEPGTKGPSPGQSSKSHDSNRTTGSGAMGTNPRQETMKKNVSPASPMEGADKEK